MMNLRTVCGYMSKCNTYAKKVGKKIIENFLCMPIIGSGISDLCYKKYIDWKVRLVGKIVYSEGSKTGNTQTPNNPSFLFITDVHWGANSRKSPIMIKYILEQTSLNKIIFGGDFITHSDTSKKTMIELGHDFMDRLRECTKSSDNSCRIYSILGNHDDNSYEQSNQAAILSDDEINSVLNKLSPGGICYMNGSYYDFYFDEPLERTRYIYLNTAKKKRNLKQEQYVCDCLASLPDGYNAVVIAHIWVEMMKAGFSPNIQTENLMQIFDAFNARTVWNEVSFESCQGMVECLIGGHIHNDYKMVTRGGVYRCYALIVMRLGRPITSFYQLEVCHQNSA